MDKTRIVFTKHVLANTNLSASRQALYSRLKAAGTKSWQTQQQRTYSNGFRRRGGFQYQRFEQVGGLLKRWAARPTFYYEAGGLASACGGFYMYNLEVVPVSRC
jgi:hypothetical protein